VICRLVAHLTNGSSRLRGTSSFTPRRGVDDLDKSVPVGVDATPRRSTSLDAMRDITAALDVNGFIVRSTVLAQCCGKLAVAIFAFFAWHAAHAERMGWALAYEGKDYPNFFYDPKAVDLIASDLNIAADSNAMAAFRGVPNPVNVLEGRYVSSSSCAPHQCPFNRGFFWLDTATGETLAARNTISYPKKLEYREHGVPMLREYSELTIGGSARSVQSISPQAMQALRSWIGVNDLRFDKVQYRSHVMNRNAHITLDPTEYSAPASHPAAR
jgi:hypothetical protein